MNKIIALRAIFFFAVSVMAALFLFSSSVKAQELYQDIQDTWKAKVTDVESEEERIIPGTDTATFFQTIKAEILEGERKGEVVTVENDYLKLEEGNTFYLHYIKTIEGKEMYSVQDISRTNGLFFFIVLFIVVIVAFGGRQGFKSLLSLVGGLLVIMYVLLPSLLKGYSPVLMSIALATLILCAAIYFTHGFNKTSSVALAGTVIAVVITSLLAMLAVEVVHLSGFSADESVYLNMATRGTLDFSGLLLAGIIIGILGVLDDIAVTQVAVVRELYGASTTITRREVYTRALRVGREHVSALVNILVLAYTGASLSLLLLFSSYSSSSLMQTLNLEVFSAEIIRMIVGSIGLVLTVPVTTLLAVVVLEKYRGRPDEVHAGHSHLGHTHNHS